MSDRALEQMAERQARRRLFNERLAALDPDGVFDRYRCECGLIACGKAIRLAPDEYAEVRSDPRWFAVYPDHVSEPDRVAATHAGWVMIEAPNAPAPSEANAPSRR